MIREVLATAQTGVAGRLGERMWRTLLLVMAAQREVFPQYHHNVDALKSVLGIQRDDDPPKEVLDLFKEKLYNVESTMNTIFASGGLQDWLQTRARLPPPDSPPSVKKRKKDFQSVKERKKENRQPKGGMGGRYTATTQGF